jgi:hypothetical protein
MGRPIVLATFKMDISKSTSSLDINAVATLHTLAFCTGLLPKDK